MAAQTATIRASGSLTPLCWLAGKYGTDKLGFYTPIYHMLLSERRSTIFKMLEVGIGTPEAMKHVPGYRPGASLRMWRDYMVNGYGPTEIFGMDINSNACAEAYEKDIKTVCCDSANTEEVLAALPKLIAGGKFDLIIDDGSHDQADQLRTFQHLSPLLADGGLYIIEDVNEDMNLGVEHTFISHVTPTGTGRAIVIRQEALHAV